MREKAMRYYREGYNCSQCIIRAVEHKYKIKISEQCYSMCRAVNNGFGIGGMCSVLTAGVMIFGLLYDDLTAKRLRIKLLSKFQQKYKTIDCGSLKHSKDGCEELVADIADMVDEIIEEEGLD